MDYFARINRFIKFTGVIDISALKDKLIEGMMDPKTGKKKLYEVNGQLVNFSVIFQTTNRKISAKKAGQTNNIEVMKKIDKLLITDVSYSRRSVDDRIIIKYRCRPCYELDKSFIFPETIRRPFIDCSSLDIFSSDQKNDEFCSDDSCSSCDGAHEIVTKPFHGAIFDISNINNDIKNVIVPLTDEDLDHNYEQGSDISSDDEFSTSFY